MGEFTSPAMMLGGVNTAFILGFSFYFGKKISTLEETIGKVGIALKGIAEKLAELSATSKQSQTFEKSGKKGFKDLGQSCDELYDICEDSSERLTELKDYFENLVKELKDSGIELPDSLTIDSGTGVGRDQGQKQRKPGKKVGRAKKRIGRRRPTEAEDSAIEDTGSGDDDEIDDDIRRTRAGRGRR